MDIDNNNEVIYCRADGEYLVYCNICEKICIERLLKNHLKSSTHANKKINTS